MPIGDPVRIRAATDVGCAGWPPSGSLARSATGRISLPHPSWPVALLYLVLMHEALPLSAETHVAFKLPNEGFSAFSCPCLCACKCVECLDRADLSIWPDANRKLGQTWSRWIVDNERIARLTVLIEHSTPLRRYDPGSYRPSLRCATLN